VRASSRGAAGDASASPVPGLNRRHPAPARGSALDPFKPRITRLLDTHPYSAQQIFQRLREEGYQGCVTIVRDYVRRIRTPKRPVYLKLHFAPGECAQVDWGAYGTVTVGNTSRRLSFFVMVLAFLCWSMILIAKPESTFADHALAAKCSSSSPSPRPWSISSPAMSTLSPRWAASFPAFAEPGSGLTSSSASSPRSPAETPELKNTYPFSHIS
jgi:hypothetical protein